MNNISRRGFLASTGAAAAVTLTTAKTADAQADIAFDNNLFPARRARQTEGFGSFDDAPPFAVRVLNKAAFGPVRGNASVFNSVAHFNSLGANDQERLTAWVDQQLNPTTNDPQVQQRFNAASDQFTTIIATDQLLWQQFVRSDDGSTRSQPFSELDRFTYVRAAYSQWQFREVMADFWDNHFNVFSQTRNETRGYMPSYHRDLRGDTPGSLGAGAGYFGNFYDLLLASAQNAAMLFYLDNAGNSWPNPNENYAREVLELHTLGAIENFAGSVDPATIPNNEFGQRSQYTETDVFQFARALTGWSVDDGRGDDNDPGTGAFLFRPDDHYDDYGSGSSNLGPLQIMDVTINSLTFDTDGNPAPVTSVLTYLAEHFGTARFIASKLCQRLVSDNPPESLVQSTALEFYNRRNDPDQLREVYRHVLLSTEFQNSWGGKARRPIETMIRAWRAADIDYTPTVDRPGTTDRNRIASDINNLLEDAGQRPRDIPFPTGYPDFRAFWQGTGTLVATWRLVTFLYSRRIDNPSFNNVLDGFDLNLAEQINGFIPNSNNRTPANIVEIFYQEMLGFLPEVGTGLEQQMDAVINFAANQAGVGISEPLDNANGYDTTDTDNSNYQRLMRATLSLVILQPTGQRR